MPDRGPGRDTPSGVRLGLVRSEDPAPGGGTDDELAAFAAEVSLRLAATLNLRRTVGLVLALAVPRLADAAVVELDGATGIAGGSLMAGGAPRTWSSRASAPREGVGEAAEVLPLRARGRELGRLVLGSAGAAVDVSAGGRRLAGELAVRAALALDAARVYEERTKLATTLRDALRPAPLPELPGVRLGARYRPAEEATEIGGDFFDVYRGPDDTWWFTMGDVCGKGVEAAVATGKVRSGLRMAALADGRPDRVLTMLNEVMLLEGGSSFVTVLVGRLAVDATGRLTLVLAGGGHLEPLVRRRSGAVEAVQTGGQLVGMLPEASFRTTELILDPGEVVVLYTDGVTEAADATGTMFGDERLVSLLADCAGMPPQAVAERIEQNVLEHLSGRPHDDIAVFALSPDDPAPDDPAPDAPPEPRRIPS